MKKKFLIYFFIIGLSKISAQYDSLEVNSIEFSGNKFFSSGTLMDVITSKESTLFTDYYLDEDDLENDKVRLKNFYNNEGFLGSIIRSYHVNVNEDRTEAEVIFTIVEGKPTLIKNINVKGNSFFSKEEILEMLTINTGDRLQYYEIIASEITLQKMLYNNGFLEAAVRSDYVLDNDEQSAEVEFEITENSRFTINEIFINGLEITNTHVVKRELEFEKGEYIDLEAVAVSKRNLYRTELFRSVIINVEPASDNSNHQRDIHVNIIEDDPGDFEISGGYGTIEKVRTSLSLSYNNILGEAYEAGLEGKITSIERGAEVYLTDPWAFGFPFGISLFGTYENKDEPSYNYSLYESSINFFKDFLRFSKVGLSAAYQISKYDDLQFSLIEKEDISQDLTPEEYNEIVRILKNLSYTFHRASLKLSFHHDLRDNIFNPAEGALIDFSSEFIYGFTNINAFGIIIDKTINRLIKNELTINAFYTFSSFATFGSSFQFGVINNFTPDKPQYFLNDLFYAGGPNGLRGFEYKKVGPLTDDRIPVGGLLKLVWNLIEVRTKLFWLFDGVAFLDIGNVWKQPDDFNFKDIRYSPGLGLRLNSPVGLVRFDYGFNPWPKAGESAGQYWIGIGHAF